MLRSLTAGNPGARLAAAPESRIPALSQPRHHTVQVPATTANLGAGFDAFGFAVDRHLVVRTRPRRTDGVRVRDVDGRLADVPTGEDNLIWTAFRSFCERYDTPVPDVSLEASSQIPLERGMGSSSAAIVAGLALARAETGTAVGDRELVGVATELEGHPDNVAAAVLGGLVACTAADDGSVITRRVTPAARLRPFLLVPVVRQGTQEARAVLPASLSRADAALQAGRAGHVLGALGGWWPMDVRASGDVLHEPSRRRVMHPSSLVLDALRRTGVHSWLSGAGPSVGVAVDALDADVGAQVRAIADAHDFEVYAVSFDLAGTVTCPDDACAFSGSPTCLQCPRRRV